MNHLDETPRQESLRQVAEKLIHQELPEMAWEAASLAEVLDEFEKASGIQLAIQWEQLELVGIDQDSLIREFVVKKQSLKEALPRLLAQVDADAFGDDKLGFTSADGILVISTLREIKAITVKRAYNIGPLLREPYRPVGLYFSDEAFEDTVAYHAWLRGERHTPLTDAMLLKIYKHHHEKMSKELAKLDPDNEVKAEQPPDHGGGLFGDDELERPEPNEFVQPVIEKLIGLIKTHTADQTDWVDEFYDIHVSGDTLIVNAPAAVQEEVHRLLNILLEAEVDKQAAMLKDAHASQQVAEANQCLQDGDKVGAMQHVNQALWIMPDHVPANAMKKLIKSLPDKPKPVG